MSYLSFEKAKFEHSLTYFVLKDFAKFFPYKAKYVMIILPMLKIRAK